MSRTGKRQTVIRLAAFTILLLSFLGPWFADTHPATQETCTAPLVWVGNGYCACLVTLVSFFKTIGNWEVWVGLPPLLPILFTSLYLLAGNHRFLRNLHLAGWFLVALYSLFWFLLGGASGQGLFLWGAGLAGAAAISLLAWEILTARHQPVRIFTS